MISAFVNGVPVTSTSELSVLWAVLQYRQCVSYRYNVPLGLKIRQLLPDIVAFWLIMHDAPLNQFIDSWTCAEDQ